MRAGICMLAGAYALQLCDTLPTSTQQVLIVVVSLAATRWRPGRLVTWFALGFVVMSFAASRGLADRLDHGLVGVDLQLTLRIVGFPLAEGKKFLRFALK